jgi:hypothetical protein
MPVEDMAHIRIRKGVLLVVEPVAGKVRRGTALSEVGLVLFSIFVSIYIPQVAICPLGSGISTLHGW